MYGVMNNESTRVEKAGMARNRGGIALGVHAGSAMLEYVIVVGALAVGLLVFMSNAFYDHVRGFGPLGQGLVAFYQRTQGGLSLPIP